MEWWQLDNQALLPGGKGWAHAHAHTDANNGHTHDKSGLVHTRRKGENRKSNLDKG